jgi:hypothetical protein
MKNGGAITKREARFLKDLQDGIFADLVEKGFASYSHGDPCPTSAGKVVLTFMGRALLKPAKEKPAPKPDMWGRVFTERPLFEHRHFVWLAGFLAEHADEKLRYAMARKLEDTNERFEHSRFLDAARGTPSGRMDYPDGRFRD